MSKISDSVPTRAPSSKWGWRRIAFTFVVLAYLGWLGLINMLLFLPAWLRWLPYSIADKISAMGHFDFLATGDTHNIIHELVFALILGTAAVGLVVQLWKPSKNVAGQLIALIAWVTMILAAAITNNWVPQPLFISFGGLMLLATILHPAGRGLFDWFSLAKADRALLALVIIAAVPLLAFAFPNIGLQIAGGGNTGLFGHSPPVFHGGIAKPLPAVIENEGDVAADDEAAHDQEHAAMGHYRNMAAFSLIIIFAGLLASFKPPGWRFAAWVAGFLPILLGLFSVTLPDAESSLGPFWGIAAIAWGVVFIVAAGLLRNRALKEAPAL